MRVLVIGAGSIGERHIRCFQQTGRATVAVCEIDSAIRQRVRTRYELEEAFDDFEGAMLHPPDAAVICTPAHLHVSMAIRLAQAGVHTLIEKPLSTCLDGIDRLKDSAQTAKTRMVLAYVYRAHPMLATMRRSILEGRFGKPLQLVALCGQNFPFNRPAYREIYYKDRATGGGAVQDALTHILNASEWLLGPITELAADAAHKALKGVEVEDTVHVVARHQSVLASYSLNQYQAPNEIVITVVCEEGTVRFEMHRNRWRWMSQPQSEWQDESQSLKRDTLFVRQANSFLDTVEGKAAPLCSLEEGIQTLFVNLAILRASETHEWISIGPQGGLVDWADRSSPASSELETRG